MPSDFVDGRHDVVDVVELRARRLVGLDALRPRDDHRIARAAEMRRDELGVVERRVARPGPAGVVHAVGLGAAERVEAADLVERRDLLLDGVRNAVLREQFADRAVLAFGAGAVVAEDVDHDRVVAYARADRARRSACRPARPRARRSRRRFPSAGAGTGAGPPECWPRRASIAARGVSFVSAGIQPSCFWRANTRSR